MQTVLSALRRLAQLTVKVMESVQDRADRLLRGDVSASVLAGREAASAFVQQQSRRTADDRSAKRRALAQAMIDHTVRQRLSIKASKPLAVEPAAHRKPESLRKLPGVDILLRNGPFMDYTQLKPIHIRALEEKLAGKSDERIASAVGLSLRSVRALLASDAGKAFLQTRIAQFPQEMQTLLGPAIEATRDMLSADDISAKNRGVNAYTKLLNAVQPKNVTMTHVGADGGAIEMDVTLQDAKTKLVQRASRFVNGNVLEIASREAQ